MPVDQTSWEAAVRHLYRDAYAYDRHGPTPPRGLGPRRPRPDGPGSGPPGWAGVDDAAQNPEREESPPTPSPPTPRSTSRRRLKEIDPASAENLLLALTDDRCTLSNLRCFRERGGTEGNGGHDPCALRGRGKSIALTSK